MRTALLLLAAVCLSAKPSPAVAQGMTSDWVAKWANSRDYTLAVAEAMPAEDYGFRPDYPVRDTVGGELRAARTFGQQLIHLADNVAWLSASKLRSGERPPRSEADPSDKAAVIAYLTEAFAAGDAALRALRLGALDEEVEWFGGSRLSRRRVGLLLFDHVTHHRAQAIVYLRMSGREAPRYVGW